MSDALPDPVLDLAFEVRVHVDAPLRVGGATPHEALHAVAITGGTVEGPRLRGEVLPGGADWFTDRDGVAALDARYLLRADDGSRIVVNNLAVTSTPANPDGATSMSMSWMFLGSALAPLLCIPAYGAGVMLGFAVTAVGAGLAAALILPRLAPASAT